MNKKIGWIKLHRKSMDSTIWHNSNVWMVWCWCLMKACREEQKFPFNGIDVELKPGQFITGMNKALEELTCDLTTQKYRTAIKYLKSTGRITSKSTNQFTVITVLNWSKYQDSETPNKQTNSQTNKPITNEQQTDNKPITTYNNIKNNKEVKEVYIYYQSKINSSSKLTDSSKKKIISRLKEYNSIQLKSAMNNFSASEWWMENNAHRGVAWFFNSEDRIDQFLNIKETKNKSNSIIL